jgi:hypothetical protein
MPVGKLKKTEHDFIAAPIVALKYANVGYLVSHHEFWSALAFCQPRAFNDANGFVAYLPIKHYSIPSNSWRRT